MTIQLPRDNQPSLPIQPVLPIAPAQSEAAPATFGPNSPPAALPQDLIETRQPNSHATYPINEDISFPQPSQPQHPLSDAQIPVAAIGWGDVLDVITGTSLTEPFKDDLKYAKLQEKLDDLYNGDRTVTLEEFDELSASELNLLVKKAGPETLNKIMALICDYSGNEMPAWDLAKKLEPKQWGKVMGAYANLGSQEQQNFAWSFGGTTYDTTYNAYVEDGANKLLAISVYKSAQEQTMARTRVGAEIAEGLKAMRSHIPMPAPMSKAIEQYAMLVEQLPKDFAKIMLNPDNYTAQLLFENTLYDITGQWLDYSGAKTLFDHFKDVYSNN